MKEYIIKKLPEGMGALRLENEFFPEKLPEAYGALQQLDIDQYPWDESGYCPEAHARIGWNSAGLHVLMYAKEPSIRTEEIKTGGMVCCDSCIEFFFKPFPQQDARYFNCESNAAAIMHIGLGDGRPGRTVWRELPKGIAPTHSRHAGAWWAVSYSLPMDWIAQNFAASRLQAGQILLGNCYKCDESIHPHFGMWSPVQWPKPDFHRPEFFAPMMLE